MNRPSSHSLQALDRRLRDGDRKFDDEDVNALRAGLRLLLARGERPACARCGRRSRTRSLSQRTTPSPSPNPRVQPHARSRSRSSSRAASHSTLLENILDAKPRQRCARCFVAEYLEERGGAQIDEDLEAEADALPCTCSGSS